MSSIRLGSSRALLLPGWSPPYSTNGSRGIPVDPHHRRSYRQTFRLAPKILRAWSGHNTLCSGEISSGYCVIATKDKRKGHLPAARRTTVSNSIVFFSQRVDSRQYHGIWVHRGSADRFTPFLKEVIALAETAENHRVGPPTLKEFKREQSEDADCWVEFSSVEQQTFHLCVKANRVLGTDFSIEWHLANVRARNNSSQSPISPPPSVACRPIMWLKHVQPFPCRPL